MPTRVWVDPKAIRRNQLGDNEPTVIVNDGGRLNRLMHQAEIRLKDGTVLGHVLYDRHPKGRDPSVYVQFLDTVEVVSVPNAST